MVNIAEFYPRGLFFLSMGGRITFPRLRNTGLNVLSESRNFFRFEIFFGDGRGLHLLVLITVLVEEID